MSGGSRFGYASQAFVTWVSKECAECGKMFECSVDTRYRFDSKVYCSYCSYGCFRMEDKRREAARKKKQEEAKAHDALHKPAVINVMRREEQMLLARIETGKEKLAMARVAFEKAKPGTAARRMASNRKANWTLIIKQTKYRLEDVRKEIARLERENSGE